MSQTQKICVVGCGHWGKNLVRNFHALGSLHSVCDNNPDVAQQFAKEYSAEALDWAQVLRDSEIAAVVIASPAPYHFQMAKDALEAGKDVYVEKPICLEDKDAEKLCEIAEQNNRILMVGHLLHYHPAFLKLQSMVRAGKIGTLNYIYSNRLSLGKIRREENVLWSFAPHDVSMILSLANDGMPIMVDATGACVTHTDIEDVAAVHMQFSNGVSAHIHTSWINPFKEHKLVVIGDKGMLVFDDREDWASKVGYYAHHVEASDAVPDIKKSDLEFIELEEAEPLKQECQHFIDCINNRETPRTDGQEGLRVLKVLNMADTAINSKKVQNGTQAKIA